MTSAADTRPPEAEAAAGHSWHVHTDGGLALVLPPTVTSLSTFVVLEQERWFEAEISLLPHLLPAGANALDIGANHGMYALEMARLSQGGHVWAFEPTSAPRQRLLQSIGANGFEDRVTVVAAAVADCEGTAHFAVHDNSELNARDDAAQRREAVRQTTVDAWMRSHGVDAPIALVKLDAEGDETRVLAGAARFFAEQSPVVLFEFKKGSDYNDELLAAWSELGYGLFRWSGELDLLLPFDAAQDERAFALNLVAVRPAQQDALAARGLLVTADALASTALPAPALAPLVELCASPALLGGPVARPEELIVDIDAAAGTHYAAALTSLAQAHRQPGLSAAERLRLVLSARDLLVADVQREGGAPASCALLVHCFYALGRQRAAVDLADQLLRRWPASALAVPVIPPHRADLARPRSTAMQAWLRQVVAEFAAMRKAFSSYFMRPAPDSWGALLDHPDHSAEVERRYLLEHIRLDRPALVDRLTRLPHPEHTRNPAIWQGLIEAMRSLRRDPAAVLAALPAQAVVSVVDVGASSLGDETEPYAPLVRAGRARITGFEPDAAALDQLRLAHPDERTHRFMPHVVGDGAAAVFHEMHWPLTSSLLPPNRPMLDRYHDLGRLVQEKSRQPVDTVRLDDVIPPGGMDLLKIDVQGAERLVFDGARQRLDECLAVWTEVEFVPLYEGQPLFADVDARLREHGLQFLCFTGLATRALQSWPAEATPAAGRPQQLWSDAIYVPTPQRLATLDAASAARMALIAHHVLQARDLCHAALLRHDALAGTALAADYLDAVRQAG